MMSDKNYVVRFEFRPNTMIAIPYIEEEYDEDVVIKSEAGDSNGNLGWSPIWSPLVWQLRNDYGLYR